MWSGDESGGRVSPADGHVLCRWYEGVAGAGGRYTVCSAGKAILHVVAIIVSRNRRARPTEGDSHIAYSRASGIANVTGDEIGLRRAGEIGGCVILVDGHRARGWIEIVIAAIGNHRIRARHEPGLRVIAVIVGAYIGTRAAKGDGDAANTAPIRGADIARDDVSARRSYEVDIAHIIILYR